MLLRRGERFEGTGNSVDADFPSDKRVAVDSTLGQVVQRGLELVAGVAEDELDIQLLVDSQHRFDLVTLHADPDDYQPRINRCGGHDRIDHARHADAFENHRRPTRRAGEPGRQLGRLGGVAVGGHLLPTVVRRLRSRIDDYVGADSLGELAATWREVRSDNRASLFELECGDHREADWAAADYQRHVLRIQ